MHLSDFRQPCVNYRKYHNVDDLATAITMTPYVPRESCDNLIWHAARRARYALYP